MSLPLLTSRLKQIFGYDEFRPLQREIMETSLARRDALAILPTGAGKSLCYQLPALVREELTDFAVQRGLIDGRLQRNRFEWAAQHFAAEPAQGLRGLQHVRGRDVDTAARLSEYRSIGDEVEDRNRNLHLRTAKGHPG